MILEAKDLMLSKLTGMAYCQIHKPIYNSASNPNCLISLFNQNIELSASVQENAKGSSNNKAENR